MLKDVHTYAIRGGVKGVFAVGLQPRISSKTMFRPFSSIIIRDEMAIRFPVRYLQRTLCLLEKT